MDENNQKDEIEILHSIDEIMKKVASCFPSDMNRNQVAAVLQLFMTIYY